MDNIIFGWLDKNLSEFSTLDVAMQYMHDDNVENSAQTTTWSSPNNSPPLLQMSVDQNSLKQIKPNGLGNW